MPNSCPDCGAPLEFNSATARVLHGDCGGCGHAFTILEGLPAIPQAPSNAPAAETDVPEGGPACGKCGAPLTLRSASEDTLEAVCSGCESEFTYTLDTAPGPSGPPRRPTRFEPETERRGGFDRPPSRPCRECGGTLQFTSTPDGLVTGECAQCGNRFTLPPRREGGGRSRYGRPGGGGFRPQYGRGRGYSRDGARGGPPPRSGGGSRPYRRRSSFQDEGDDDSDRRRRRPRRE